MLYTYRKGRAKRNNQQRRRSNSQGETEIDSSSNDTGRGDDLQEVSKDFTPRKSVGWSERARDDQNKIKDR